MPEFLESPFTLLAFVPELEAPESFFETPRLTMPMSLTRTADPAFYFEFVVIGLGWIFCGLPPSIDL